MDKIVGLGEHVQVVHPGSATIAGRAQVRCGAEDGGRGGGGWAGLGRAHASLETGSNGRGYNMRIRGCTNTPSR